MTAHSWPHDGIIIMIGTRLVQLQNHQQWPLYWQIQTRNNQKLKSLGVVQAGFMNLSDMRYLAHSRTSASTVPSTEAV